MFDFGPSFDYTSQLGCNLTEIWNLIAIGWVYSAGVYFWLFRLIKIFHGTIYAFCVKNTKLLIRIYGIGFGMGFLLFFIAFLMSHFDEHNDRFNLHVFCRYKVNIGDFLPVLNQLITSSENDNDIDYNYNYKINNFYTCQMRSECISSYILLVGKILALISIPIWNSFLFYQFFKKMNRLIKNSCDNNTNCNSDFDNKRHNKSIFDEKQLYYVYLNCIIGITSVGTTLTTMLLVVFNSNLFVSLLYFDIVVNGYLMLLVYNFGNKLLPKCCRKRILRFIKRSQNKREKLQLASTETSQNGTTINQAKTCNNEEISVDKQVSVNNETLKNNASILIVQ